MFDSSQDVPATGSLRWLKIFARALPPVTVGAIFVFIGYTKFDADPHGQWFQVFERIGFGQWFRVFTGVVQVAGGALLPFRRARTAGAALLGSTMVGAAITDAFVFGTPLLIIPLILLFVIAIVWVTSR